MYDRRPPYHRRFYRPPHLRGPSRCGSARDGGGVVRPRLPDLPLRHGHGLRPRRRRSGPRVPRFRNRIGLFSCRGFRCRLFRLGPSFRFGPFSRLGSRLGPFFCRDFCCGLFLCSGFRILVFSCHGSRLGPFFCRDFCCSRFLCSGFRILFFSCLGSRLGPFFCRDFCCGFFLRSGFRILFFSRRIFRICFSCCHGFCIGLFSRRGSGPAFSAHADARSAAGRRNPFPGTGEPLPGRGPRTLPACAGCRRS